MGILFVNQQVQDERLKTCLACPLVIVNEVQRFPRDTIIQKLIAMVKDLNELQCSVCGCPSKVRAKQAIVGCPKGKWKR